MWFLGHTALSMLVVIVLAWVLKMKVEANEFFLLIFFANLPDFFHIYKVRDFISHNLIGAS